MYKKDNSSIEKHHTGQFHKEKLKSKSEDKSLNWEASVVRRLALDASFFNYSMMVIDGLDLLSAFACKTPAK